MSEDPDLVITSVDPSLRKTSKLELRRKLIAFLAVSLPPVPLSYDTFEAHVKARFETYYDSILREVFDSLLIQCAQRRLDNTNGSDTTNDLITISSSSDESEPDEPEPERKESKQDMFTESNPVESSYPATPASASTSNVRSSRPNRCAVKRSHALSNEELFALKAEKCTKKYTRYLQETYELIKSIEQTSSCSICCKLKRRIHKFKSSIGRESAVIRQKVAKELKTHGVSPEEDLSEDALEKLRTSILVDKLIEISMPDILKSVAMMDHNAEDCQSTEEEMKSRKKIQNIKRKSGEVESTKEETKVKKKEDENKNYEAKKIKKKPVGSNLSQPSVGESKSRARKISVKIKESSHPDLL